MNPELQRELATWLASLRESAGNGMNFAIEQAPIVVREKVAFGRAYETTWLVVALLVTVATGWLAYWLLRTRAEREQAARDRGNQAREGDASIQAFAACVGCAVATLLTVGQSYYVYLVWLAPRVYILEWLMSMMERR